jgi:aspartyl/asparaginyl-tRNA synthetase
LTEFIGLDLEMAFESHYEEVMDLIDGMFLYIFKNLQTKHKDEIETVRLTYPSEDLVFLPQTLKLNFADGVKILVESGWKEEDGSTPSELEDLSTAGERRLGQLVKEKYGTDYYILSKNAYIVVIELVANKHTDKFPAAVRPFYTMRDPHNDVSLHYVDCLRLLTLPQKLSNSYDFFIRGEEILSGGQRIHDAPLLEERMREAGIDPESMKEYLDGFKYGCPPVSLILTQLE